MLLLKCCIHYASKFGKLRNGHRTGKGQFSFQSPKKVKPKNVQITVQLHSFHMPARLCSKSFKLGFSSMWTENSRFTSCTRGTRDQISNIRWIIVKARKFQKNIYFYFVDYAKAFDYVDHNKLWKIHKEIGIPNHLTCLLRNLYAGQEAAVRTRHGTMNWFQIGKWTGFKLGKTHQGCVLSPCLLKYIMQNAGLDNVKTGIKIARRNINNLIYEHDTTFMAESEEKLKSFLIKWKRRMKKLAENSTFGKVRS